MADGSSERVKRLLLAPERVAEECRRIVSGPPFAVLDFETTGFDAPGICEYALAICRVGETGLDVQEHRALVNPCRAVEEGARKVHGITDEELSRAYPWKMAWPRVLDLLSRSCVRTMVAYNVEHEVRVLRHNLERYGLSSGGVLDLDWYCLMEAAVEMFEAEKWCSLSVACARVGVVAPSHRALADVRSTLALLQAFAAWTPGRTY